MPFGQPTIPMKELRKRANELPLNAGLLPKSEAKQWTDRYARHRQLKLLLESIENVQRKKALSLLQHFVERAYISDKVLIALMNKILPDKHELEANGPISLSISFGYRNEEMQIANRAGIEIQSSTLRVESDDGQTFRAAANSGEGAELGRLDSTRESASV